MNNEIDTPVKRGMASVIHNQGRAEETSNKRHSSTRWRLGLLMVFLTTITIGGGFLFYVSKEKELAWRKVEIARLEAAVTQLSGDLKNALVKKRQNAETVLVLKGILYDETTFLEQSRRANSFRQDGHYGEPHEFGFKHWMIPYQKKILEYCIDHNKTNSLRWIMNEDEWDKYIDDDLKQRAIMYRNLAKLPKERQELYNQAMKEFGQ